MRKAMFLFYLMTFTCSITLAQIEDIKSFLEKCPTSDPVIDTLLKDFEIRLNGELVTDFPCTEPISDMDTLDYTNPLIYLQTLRVIYYIDKEMNNHLPWTDTTLYVWLKNAADGIDIVDGIYGGTTRHIEGKYYILVGNYDGEQREFDKYWKGISGNIGLLAHEGRHLDTVSPSHTSCCGIPWGCDQEYNENNLGAYGIQYWLNKAWLNGFIDVGAKVSHTQEEINDIIKWHLNSLNMTFRNRFCDDIPDMVYLSDIGNPLVSSSTIIEDLNYPDNFNLYPNPVKRGRYIRIELPNIKSVEIYNMVGMQIKTDYLSSNNYILVNTSNFVGHCYIIKMVDSKGNISARKLIVQ